MSKETLTWLNQNVLIGGTDWRARAWHDRPDLKGAEDNHYPGFIPAEDVVRRLFNFDPYKAQSAFLKEVKVIKPSRLDIINGRLVKIENKWYEIVVDADHVDVVDPDTDVVLGVHGSEYVIHDYREWGLDGISTLLDQSKDELGITSAGLLRQRKQAWVEVSVPDAIETVDGVMFRPNLLFFTSLDASLATTIKRTIGFVVCDNTLNARIGESGEELRIRHTQHSLGRLIEAREALNLIFKAKDDFTEELERFLSVSVTEDQWQGVLNALVPFPMDENGKVKTKGRGLTIVENRREKLEELYNTDPRCEPWTGTKFGVIQTFNTWKTHYATVRNTQGGGRVERNLTNVLDGKQGAFDTNVAETVDKVLEGVK